MFFKSSTRSSKKNVNYLMLVFDENIYNNWFTYWDSIFFFLNTFSAINNWCEQICFNNLLVVLEFGFLPLPSQCILDNLKNIQNLMFLIQLSIIGLVYSRRRLSFYCVITITACMELITVPSSDKVAISNGKNDIILYFYHVCFFSAIFSIIFGCRKTPWGKLKLKWNENEHDLMY